MDKVTASLKESGGRLLLSAKNPLESNSATSTAPSTPEFEEQVTASGFRRRRNTFQEEYKDCEFSGPVDLDESIADDLSVADNSWVMSPDGMASRDLYIQKGKPIDTTCFEQVGLERTRAVTRPFTRNDDDDDDDDAKHSPFLWTDDDEDHKRGHLANRKISEEDAVIIDQSFHQAMKSLSMRSISTNLNSHEDGNYCISESEAGSVLLTRQELQRHLNKIQSKEPPPSSCIRGYDKWKERKEGQKRYFDRLRKKTIEQETQRRYYDAQPQDTAPSPFALSQQRSERYKLYDDVTLATKGQMDQSVDSTIATLVDDSQFKPRQHSKPKQKKKNFLSRWKAMPKFHPKKKKGPSEERSKGVTLVSLKQFMRISEDEPSEIGDFSLAPLNKMKSLTLDSVFQESDESSDATKSHVVDCENYDGPKQLAMCFLEIERQRQLQSELEKDKYEWMEQERILRLKETELKRQRELNTLPPMNSPPRARSHSPRRPSYVSNTTAIPFKLAKTRSFSSKTSTVSPFLSHSTITLSPCVICNTAERTHVAMPCMHFYFCETCVKDMKSLTPVFCPVCSCENVVFSRVHT
jgi:hypothetical protein